MKLDSADAALKELETLADDFIAKHQNDTKTKSELLQIERETNKIEKEIEILSSKFEKLNDKLKNKLTENESLKKTHSNLEEQIVNLEKKCKDLQSCFVVRNNDNMKLVKARDILYVGIKLTGIRFDFSAPDNVIKGYIANKDKNILRPFEFSKNEEDHQTELWDFIESASTDEWTDVLKNYQSTDDKKENIPSN